MGEGALRYHDLLAGAHEVEIADAALTFPDARSLVLLAHAIALREEFVQHWEIEPVYLRKPDAEIKWETRHGQHVPR